MLPFILGEASVMPLNYSWYSFLPSEVPPWLPDALRSEGYRSARLTERAWREVQSSSVMWRRTKISSDICCNTFGKHEAGWRCCEDSFTSHERKKKPGKDLTQLCHVVLMYQEELGLSGGLKNGTVKMLTRQVKLWENVWRVLISDCRRLKMWIHRKTRDSTLSIHAGAYLRWKTSLIRI